MNEQNRTPPIKTDDADPNEAVPLPGTGARRGLFGEPGITGGLGEMGGAGANGGMQPDIAKSNAK